MSVKEDIIFLVVVVVMGNNPIILGILEISYSYFDCVNEDQEIDSVFKPLMNLSMNSVLSLYGWMK